MYTPSLSLYLCSPDIYIYSKSEKEEEKKASKITFEVAMMYAYSLMSNFMFVLTVTALYFDLSQGPVKLMVIRMPTETDVQIDEFAPMCMMAWRYQQQQQQQNKTSIWNGYLLADVADSSVASDNATIFSAHMHVLDHHTAMYP